MTTDIFQFQGTIQLRRGSSSDWTNINPILSEGEMGIELDTLKFKLGDGINKYRDLPYAGTPGAPGLDGIDGRPGSDGLDGRNGIDGSTGPKGSTGVFDYDGMMSLPYASSVGLTDEVPVVQGTDVKRASIASIRDSITKQDIVWEGKNTFLYPPILLTKDMYTTPVNGAVTINWAGYGAYRVRLNGASTMVFSGLYQAGEVNELFMELSVMGNYVITWPTNIKWPNGVVLVPTVGGTDSIRFVTIDGGVTFQAFVYKNMRGA